MSVDNSIIEKKIAETPFLVEQRGPSAVPITGAWADEWVARAALVRARLSAPARAGTADRIDRIEAITLLKRAGLLTLPGLTAGGGPGPSTADRVVREIAAVDAHLGRLLAAHYRWSRVGLRAGRRAQAEANRAAADAGQWFFAGPAHPDDLHPDDLHPDDLRLEVRGEGHHVVFNGRHTFIAGSVASDVTVLDGVLPDRGTGTGVRVLAIVPSRHPGLMFHDEANEHDERLMNVSGDPSGRRNSVCVAEVRVASTDLLVPSG